MISTISTSDIVRGAVVLWAVNNFGCTNPYSFVCHVQLGQPERIIGFSELRASVGAAIAPFGYELTHSDNAIRQAVFERTAVPSSEASALPGATARVEVSVGGVVGDLVVVITDFSDRHETEYIRALRQQIHARLESDLGVRARFEYYWSPFAP